MLKLYNEIVISLIDEETRDIRELIRDYELIPLSNILSVHWLNPAIHCLLKNCFVLVKKQVSCSIGLKTK